MRKDEEDLHTMLAWRLTQRNMDRWREVIILISFMLVFLFGAGVVGAFQYFIICQPKYPSATVQECLSMTPIKAPGVKAVKP